MTDSIARAFGPKVSDATRTSIRQVVDKAADASAAGDKATGWSAVDDVAANIANSDDTFGATTAEADDIEDDDPAALAARISR